MAFPKAFPVDHLISSSSGNFNEFLLIIPFSTGSDSEILIIVEQSFPILKLNLKTIKRNVTVPLI